MVTHDHHLSLYLLIHGDHFSLFIDHVWSPFSPLFIDYVWSQFSPLCTCDTWWSFIPLFIDSWSPFVQLFIVDTWWPFIILFTCDRWWRFVSFIHWWCIMLTICPITCWFMSPFVHLFRLQNHPWQKRLAYSPFSTPILSPIGISPLLPFVHLFI